MLLGNLEKLAKRPKLYVMWQDIVFYFIRQTAVNLAVKILASSLPLHKYDMTNTTSTCSVEIYYTHPKYMWAETA